ncbi:MAG TPA: FadR/GntR family transcriptional regulator [Longimicrobium sp.]|jgi:GntR family transcriptional repressor for pyruvate dehydrogenase complex
MDSGIIARQSLSDELAQRLRQMIHARGYQPGDRLPSIVHMAREFGVAHPTLREALRKLETLGIVEIRHGSGVYAGVDDNSLLITNPVFEGSLTRKMLLDLVEARTSIELKSAVLAATHATRAQLRRMRELLGEAGRSLDDPLAVSEANRAFHREIALASGNQVLHQLLQALGNVFQEEQRFVNATHAARERFHREHLEILDALERRDPARAGALIEAHLAGVRAALTKPASQETENHSES